MLRCGNGRFFRGEAQAGVVDLLGAVPAYPAVSDSRIGGEMVTVSGRERTETGPKSVSISPGPVIWEGIGWILIGSHA